MTFKNIDEQFFYTRIFDDAGSLLISLLKSKFTYPDDMIRMGRAAEELYNKSKRYGISINPKNLVLNPTFNLPGLIISQKF